MEENFPVATSEELANNTDDCAICWDHMNNARKLPCGHFFHTTCLRSWLEQDTSCPTCRHSLRMQEDDNLENNIESDPNDANNARGLFNNTNIRFTNHFFQFDGSRYARWLPTLSVEVTRPSMQNVNANGLWFSNDFSLDFGQQQIENMGQQVSELFPQISLSAILEDLRVTRSVEHTIENILDWDGTRLRESTYRYTTIMFVVIKLISTLVIPVTKLQLRLLMMNRTCHHTARIHQQVNQILSLLIRNHQTHQSRRKMWNH